MEKQVNFTTQSIANEGCKNYVNNALPEVRGTLL